MKLGYCLVVLGCVLSLSCGTSDDDDNQGTEFDRFSEADLAVECKSGNERVIAERCSYVTYRCTNNTWENVDSVFDSELCDS